MRWIAALLILAGAGGAYWWWQQRPDAPQYVTAPVTSGPVVRSIVTTGSVNPVVTVQVGSYVSGVIQSLACDYNTEVKAGQLCAKIDPRPYQVVVDQNTANLASGEAQLNKDTASLVYAKANYARDLKLSKQKIVSQDAIDTDKSALDQALAQVDLDKATVDQRRAALAASQVNLDYTNIVSPVDGIVVSRNVDVGQTVAASFQTPTLFLIAQDLTKMQVDTNVSESDVGGAKVGQRTTFTVDAYPDKTFEGHVVQVRQAPITVQNVVTYDVVIGVDNPNRELFPGMTANARIVIDERPSAVRVPLQALRYNPQRAPRPTQAGSEAPAHVWALTDGKPRQIAVTTGLNDGTYVEITGGDVKPGDAVIVNEARSAAGATAPQVAPLRL